MPSSLFDVVDADAWGPSVARGRMFRSHGLRLAPDGAYFALDHGEHVVLKLPAVDARRLVDTGRATPFTVGTRVMREWVVVPTADPELAGLVEHARRFVAGA